MALDALFFGAHPDDVELTSGGLAALLASHGHRVGIVDLTCGEAGTRGAPEQRARRLRPRPRLWAPRCGPIWSFPIPASTPRIASRSARWSSACASIGRHWWSRPIDTTITRTTWRPRGSYRAPVIWPVSRAPAGR